MSLLPGIANVSSLFYCDQFVWRLISLIDLLVAQTVKCLSAMLETWV